MEGGYQRKFGKETHYRAHLIKELFALS